MHLGFGYQNCFLSNIFNATANRAIAVAVANTTLTKILFPKFKSVGIMVIMEN